MAKRFATALTVRLPATPAALSFRLLIRGGAEPPSKANEDPGRKGPWRILAWNVKAAKSLRTAHRQPLFPARCPRWSKTRAAFCLLITNQAQRNSFSDKSSNDAHIRLTDDLN